MLNALMKGFRQKLSEEKVLQEQQKLRDNLAAQKLANELEAVKNDAKIESAELLAEIESLETQLADEKDRYRDLKEEHSKKLALLADT